MENFNNSGQQSENVPGDRSVPQFLITGIGASAGGVQALQTFFKNVPDRSGIAYVVILHLSPDHDSMLAEILKLATSMPVTQVKEKVLIKPDHVYVVPPDHHLIVEDESIVVSKNILLEERRAPIDIFFRSLGDTHGERSVCVVLSGTGANGSMGLKRVKEKGGAIYVQDPQEAEFSEMVRHAMDTGLVDEVLPVSAIPARIIAYRNNFGIQRIPVEADNDADKQRKDLIDIFSLLRLRTGHDFTNYKRPTVLRRIERRMQVHNLSNLQTYKNFIHDHPEELDSLLKDLLISVTNFFRDKETFEVLDAQVLPQIFSNKSSDDQVRIWVVGCATGEEAYSIAMLCAEKMLGVPEAPKVQIFATDIDETALTHARQGFYTLNDAADVSQERLNLFFNKEANGYRIRREIREMVLFVNHNFLKDPPFSHLELVSCRNVLIYLNQKAQQRAMDTFHFSLNTGAFMMLGSSESVNSATHLYNAFNPEHHIFRSLPVTTGINFPVPESVPTFQVDKTPFTINNLKPELKPAEGTTFADIHQQLLELYAPPSVVINDAFDIVHLSKSAGRYLQFSAGELSRNLLKLVRDPLRLELRSALYLSLQRKTAVRTEPIRNGEDENAETIRIHVKPVIREGHSIYGYTLVIFEPATGAELSSGILTTSVQPIAQHLEEEVMMLKTQLSTSIEQHEVHAEELKASNEELQAMNEELRSAAEELETGKEELQSINEELRTLNQELKVKIEETNVSSNNLKNLINSTEIATIFLDRDFRISLFTPNALEIFNLIPSDYGRPLSDITNRLLDDKLITDAEKVLEKLYPVEREMRTSNDRVYLVRLSPYRTMDDHIQGVVLTFVDITERKRAEEAKFFLASIVESSQDSIITVNFQNIITSWNERSESLYGYTAEEVIGKSLNMLELPADLKTVLENVDKVINRKTEEVFDTVQLYKDGQYTILDVMLSPVNGKNGNLIGVSAIARDITERKKAEETIRVAEERHRIALQSGQMGAWDWHITEDKVIWNNQHFTLVGLPPRQTELKGNYFMQFVHPDDQQLVHNAIKRAIEEGSSYQLEFRIITAANNRLKWVRCYGSVVEKIDDKATRMAGVIYDTTDRKRLEQQKDEFIAIASHELRTPLTSIKIYSHVLTEALKQETDNKRVSMVTELDGQVDHLIELMNSLLDTTRITEGHLDLKREKFNIRDLIMERINMLQLTTQIHQLILLPGSDEIISADRERIGQVLTNLISNAIKYSPDGGDVIVESIKEGNNLKVSISDKGVGIPDKMLQQVFERFFRVNNSQNSAISGVGLGLYITAGIINRHGGTISVKSKPDEGSSFSFILPIH